MLEAKKIDFYKNSILEPWKFQGLGIQSEVLLNVFQRGNKVFKLNRTKYEILPSDHFNYDFKKSLLHFPVLKGEDFHLELKLITLNDTEERFIIRSLKRNIPFKINGAWVFEAYLNFGDIVEIGLNKIKCFSKLESSIDKPNKILLDEKIVKSKLPILITGETGVGKTTLAKRIHEESYVSGPFVHINLSSFSPTIIESELFGHVRGAFTGALNDRKGCILAAHQGTLFIDEIDSVNKELQTKLLLFLDSRKFKPVGSEIEYSSDCRLIFSSGSSLENLVQEQLMRKDFYFRLHSGEKINLPNLRENKNLIREYIEQFSSENGILIDSNLVEFYMNLPWPGNFRELESHFEKKLIKEKSAKWILTEDDLVKKHFILNDLSSGQDQVLTLDEFKDQYVLKMFSKLNENILVTARTLKVSPNTIRAIVAKNKSRSDNVVEVNF